KNRMTLMEGMQLGPYKIIAPLGAGGMGEVYRARDSRLDRDVAIKVLPERLANNAVALKRFEREAKAVAALSHPNILEIHDFGAERNLAYAVTELLEGETLRAQIARSPLPWKRALEIALSVAEGLAAAHSKGVIHRDLKPENIFLTSDGRVKILDFGLARYSPELPRQEITSSPTESFVTEAGMVMGTVPYMSPEQVRGEVVDERSDIFSFGCILYEMLNGQRAFPGNTSADVISAILKEHPPDPPKSGSLAPAGFLAIVHRCLKKDPQHRFESMRELISALRNVQEETSRPLSLSRHVSQQIKRPVVTVMIMVIALLAGFALFSIFRQRGKARWAREEALPQIERLINEEKFYSAFTLARSANQYISDDPALKKLWPRMSRVITVRTSPEDAGLYIKEYADYGRNWEYIGRSPLNEVRIPLGLLRWKAEKEGYETVERTESFPFKSPNEKL
ncbi:MAG TPA: serine/threonine-protein kinase, partial [Acidobacteriota bacterium]